MDVFSNLMVIGECLLDTRRTKAFKRAIEETVKPGDVVLDVGTGSGILGMFAAKAGAKKVYAVDIAPDIAKFAKQNVVNNGLKNKMEVINADMKTMKFPHAIDVVLMELLDTGLVAEQQGIAINNLQKQGIITEKTRLVPYRYQCAFELVDYDFNFYGMNMPFVIQARNFAVMKHIKKKLSKTIIYQDINFSEPVNTNIDVTIKVIASSTGVINALVLKSKTFLSRSYAVWGTTDMNMPVIIPLDEKKVKKGDELKVKIAYKMGEGFGNFSAKLFT
jgi:predicted RNA methylase